MVCPCCYSLAQLARLLKKSREREPEQVEFRIHYELDGNLPVEKFFMATDPHGALKALAHSLVKPLTTEVMSEAQVESFTNAFANPHDPFPPSPEMIPVPEEIEDMEFPEEEQAVEASPAEQTVSEQPIDQAPPDPFMDSDSPAEGAPVPEPAEEENPFPGPPKVKKPSPAKEHARKKAEREQQISEANAENQRRNAAYQSLVGKSRQLLGELSGRLSILDFERFNRWADRWDALSYPPDREEDEALLQD